MKKRSRSKEVAQAARCLPKAVEYVSPSDGICSADVPILALCSGTYPNRSGRTGEGAIGDAEAVDRDPEPSGTTYVDVFRDFFQQLTTEELEGVLEIAREPHSSCVIVPSAQGHREAHEEHAAEPTEPNTACKLFYALYHVLRVAERSRVLKEGQAEERRRGIV